MTTLADVIVSDPADIPGNPNTVREALTEAVTTASEAPVAAQPAPAPAEKALPEKFRNKSVEDVVEMYQNLESRYGTMANDLGVQRQLTDRLLDLKRSTDLQTNTPPSERKPKGPPVTANDILDRPQETLERVVGERVSTVTDDVNARLARMEQSLAQQHFAARHSDYQSVVASPEFKGWLESSALRLRAAGAANAGNWQIADELLSEFKTSQGGTRRTDAPAEKPQADLAGARRAALETSGNAGATDGKSGGGKKIYRRSDLIRLRIDDPDAYYDEGFQAEIQLAHHEGRVK